MKLKICRFLSAALVMVMLTGLGTAFAVFSEWSVRVEAEDGVMTGTVRTENVIGDSGRTVSFIDNGPANSLELQVTPQGGTDYIMKLRYRSGEVRDLLYQINGGPTGRISGFNSGSWNTFANMSVPVALNPGQVNTVRFFAPDGENGPGLDYVGFSASDVPPVDKPGYRLIFQDEFDGETLDDSRWVPQYLSSWAQKPELAEPTYIMENGLMRLQIFAETQPWCPEYDGETVVSGFTTGDRNALHNWNGTNAVRNPVEMQATHLNQYGYYEIRAKGQSGSARHAAWWLLGFEDVPDESAEIDIFEILGNNSHKVPVNFHAWNDPDAPDGGGFSYTNRQMDFHEEFHIYGFNWIEGGGQGEAPDKMEFYVDGVKTVIGGEGRRCHILGGGLPHAGGHQLHHGVVGNELQAVLVAGDHHAVPAVRLALAGDGADQVVGLPALLLITGNVQGVQHLFQHRHLDPELLRHGLAGGLVGLRGLMAEGWSVDVEGDAQRVRRLLPLQSKERGEKSEDGVGVKPVPCGERTDAVIGPIQDAVAVDDHELHGEFLLPAG